MPNRILKESICTSDSLNQLSPFEETFFLRLIVNCDDFGRFDARSAILKARLFPLKERLSLKDIESALGKLADVGCVKLYSVDSKPYLYLPTWEVHQNVRAKKSKYPSPDEISEQQYADTCKQMNTDASECPRNPNPNPNPNPNTESESYSDDARLNEAMKEYVSFRKQIRSPMTERAIKLAMNNLEKLSGGDIDIMVQIIDQSIMNGWKGLFALKNEGRQQSGKKQDTGQFYDEMREWVNERDSAGVWNDSSGDQSGMA